ncbi:hypothetical protein ACS0TY_024805 [Phlomoides rotata]
MGGEARWIRPDSDTIKVNTDAAVRENQGVGIGGVARNCYREVRWCFARTPDLERNVDVAEAYAAYSGVKLAKERQVSSVVLETDSQRLLYA